MMHSMFEYVNPNVKEGSGYSRRRRNRIADETETYKVMNSSTFVRIPNLLLHRRQKKNHDAGSEDAIAKYCSAENFGMSINR